MKRPNRFALALLLLCCAQCGYFEDLSTGVEKTPAMAWGVVVDELTGRPLPGAAVSLGAETTVTDSRGAYRFDNLYTGEKTLTVNMAGYPAYAKTLRLTKGRACADSIALLRLNRKPVVTVMEFPASLLQSMPVRLQIRCTVSDSDFASPYSGEVLSVELFLGENRSDLPRIAGKWSLSAGALLTLPDTLIPSLQPGRTYYWYVRVRDLANDADSSGLDSFTTEASVPACSTGMVLVENMGSSFCMDRYEVSVSQYRKVYPTYNAPSLYYKDVRDTVLPAAGVDFFDADTFCQKKGKRLCTLAEWQTASAGYAVSNYPYGAEYDSRKCNTEVRDLYRPVVKGGTFTECVSVYGAYDLSGNVSEWVRYDEETDYTSHPTKHYPLYWKMGGTWLSRDFSGTFSSDTTQAASRADVGFRCCQKTR